MQDLSEWHFARDFSSFEAASLMLGIEPNNSSEEQRERIQIVVRRLKHSYTVIKAVIRAAILQSQNEEEAVKAEVKNYGQSVGLLSDNLDIFCFEYYSFDRKTPLVQWLEDEEQCDFRVQRFTRREIARWLKANGLESAYPFNKGLPPALAETALQSQPVLTVDPPGRWPWGSHHTDLLGHLEAAARRFWVNYDPSDQTTAHKNEEVSQWLQTERNVSKTMAEPIASILRVDGLKAGPRR